MFVVVFVVVVVFSMKLFFFFVFSFWDFFVSYLYPRWIFYYFCYFRVDVFLVVVTFWSAY